jgi:hypothetical protein
MKTTLMPHVTWLCCMFSILYHKLDYGHAAILSGSEKSTSCFDHNTLNQVTSKKFLPPKVSHSIVTEHGNTVYTGFHMGPGKFH